MPPTVPTTTDRRETIAANLLNPGDWLVFDEGHDGYEIDLRKVLSTYPYADGDERVMLVAESVTGVPVSWHLFAEAKVQLATSIEVATSTDSKARHQLADQLRDIALLVDQTALPMTSHSNIAMRLDFHLDTLPEVEAVAEMLDLKLTIDSAGRHAAIYCPAGEPTFVQAEWFTYVREPKPDPTGLDYSREADDPTPVSPAVPAYVQGEPEGHQPGRKLTPAPTPEPVHHFAEQGVTSCNQDVRSLPKGEGYGQARDAVNCGTCVTALTGCE